MSTPATVSFPVRMPSDMKAQISALASSLGISEQDILRLCLRIGLMDIESVQKDHAQLVKAAADEMGKSFSAWAKGQASEGKTKAPPTVKSGLIHLPSGAPGVKMAEAPAPAEPAPPAPRRKVV